MDGGIVKSEPPHHEVNNANAHAAIAANAAVAAANAALQREREHVAALERDVRRLREALTHTERAADLAQKPLLRQLDALQEENKQLKRDSNALAQTWEYALSDLFGQLGAVAEAASTGSHRGSSEDADGDEEMEVEVAILANDSHGEDMEQVKGEADGDDDDPEVTIVQNPQLQQQQRHGDSALAAKIEALQRKYEDLRQELSKTQLKLHLDTPDCEAGLGGLGGFPMARSGGGGKGGGATKSVPVNAHNELPSSVATEEMVASEETVQNSWSSTQEDSEDDRSSPFCTGQAPPVLNGTYRCDALGPDKDEMEVLRFRTQTQVLKRHFELHQKEASWGKLDVRSDKRVFFHPGMRRLAVLKEKRFHDQSCAEGMVNGDLEWYKGRQTHFTEMYRRFMQEEAIHKQELMQMHLEKTSPFCNLPVLADRFVLQRLLGKGGSGEVWDVIDYADNRLERALKLSSSEKRAQREHYTHSRLCHPNIVTVGEAAYTIEYRQQHYTVFTIERMKSDLHQLIEIHQHFDEHWALGVLYHLLNALTYLHHDMKIAHYDIKPTNILVGADESVKLTDFDLARHVDEPTAPASVGTRRFLPPECFRASFPQHAGTAEKADIWMVGVVYCLMLWGKHPVISDKATPAEVDLVLARYNGRLQYPQPVSELSRWIIQGCLHPDPRCRPSAFQLLQGLQHVIEAD